MRYVNLTHLVSLTEKDLNAKTISDEVDDILGSLDGGNVSDDIDFEVGISEVALRTSLTDHQRTALRFIRGRETHERCQEMHQNFRLVTGTSSHADVPSYLTGGILADVMGLGKTLSMISAILSSLHISRQRPSYPDGAAYLATDVDGSCFNTGATLVVVTSMQVLKVWETEIDKHVEPNTLKTVRFHGKARPTSPSQLIDHDIVFTTYGTLSASYKKCGVLHQVNWYRVVLDEAHWIRNENSTQYKAATSLKSVRRWCLTGTPIANKLGDLVSLLRFLHFGPFSSPVVFNQYILQPLREDSGSGALRLRALLRTICLRRDERLLKLPKTRLEQIEVTLQQEEQQLYSDIMTQCARVIDEVVSSRANVKKYGVLFAVTVKLRRLCNHGAFTITSTRVSSTGVESTLERDEGCDFCNGAMRTTWSLSFMVNFAPSAVGS
ncbi:SNF2 family N-terminal domain-containing protein [Chaetomium strumarium]|uniref:SNF2 family N-terminal domain-containing protein n=1 Tax=Chaetomium strumarium TaxID=1170767 RepID=A0AAJ0GL21_9PEZI|nr:SNF2 family N-terminal domain-containing protein [Chaetomium strumarium]